MIPSAGSCRKASTCHIRKVTLDRSRWSIQVALDYPPGMKQLDSNQSWVVNNEMVLESTDGKKHLSSREYALETCDAAAGGPQLSFPRSRGVRARQACRVESDLSQPANLIEMPIKFTFKDIELP